MKYTGRLVGIGLVILSAIIWTIYLIESTGHLDYVTTIISNIVYGISFWWLGRIYDHSQFYKQRFQQVVENVQEVIFQIDEQGRWTYLNPAWEQITGYPVNESLGKSVLDFAHIEDFDGLEAKFEELLKNHIEYAKKEIKIKKSDGSHRWILVNVKSIHRGPANRGFIGTFIDITELKEAEASLIVAKEQAEQWTKNKSEFLSTMSHEIRTPLNAMLGFSQLLERSDLPPIQKEDLQEIIKAGKHLEKLIEDVLDLSKVEAGQISLNMGSVEISQLIHNSVTLLQPLAQQGKLSIRVECIPTYVYADKTRLEQIMLNLISNAIKYNFYGGKITITTRFIEKHRLRIVVADTGMGIRETELTNIFKPFYRINQMSRERGAGLGLTVTKHLVESMGGKLGVESIVNNGSTFWVDLNIIESVSPVYPLDTQPTYLIPTIPNKEGYQLLYIEDDMANIQLMERILSEYPSIQLKIAVNGFIGLSMAQQYTPHIILLDICLPEMDGYGIFQKLQSIEKTKDIPVVAISANAYPSEREKALSLGFTDYITKPINIMKLFRVIQPILDKQH